jgi:hypothetical protein
MASELILILSDFSPLAQSAPDGAAPPRLPALETLLAKSVRSELPGGWRGWLAARYAGPELAALSMAAVAARAALGPTAAHYWLATPLHYFAGIDSVHLHPAGLLQLTDAEQARLVADFNADFADTPWRLHAMGSRELLLSGEPLAASGADPAEYAGRDPADGLPQGTAAATLRRLGVEIEMWLHGHQINEARQARGLLTVTTLWFWGSLPQCDASSVQAAGATASAPIDRLYGRDVYAQSLWRLLGAESRARPEAFADAAEESGTRIVISPSLDAEGLTHVLQAFEAQWVLPALQALRARRLTSIWLLAADAAYRLRWLDLARWWRVRAPWWERLN